MLTQAKKLHDMGFAIHWLYPKEKRPIEMKWASGPRKSWAEVKAAYRKDFNMGVRLGKASKIKGKYLSVIDCDVKSTDVKDEEEMSTALIGLFGSCLSRSPIVESGRGNGSQHIYVLTDEPMLSKKLLASDKIVKVSMPGAKAQRPSKRELETLTKKEIESGIRLRAAWEISIMGEGQQVVLPPSIHPDSGRQYKWAQSDCIENIRSVVLSDLSSVVLDKKENTFLDDFKAVPVSLFDSGLSDDTIAMIREGQNCEDRSAALFSVSIAMLNSGFSEAEILSVLTDKDHFLGQAAFEHAKTDSRKKAASWLLNYTLKKAQYETSAQRAFSEVYEDEQELSDEQAAKQHEKLTTVKEWTDELERGSLQGGGRPKNTLKNVLLILRNAVSEKVFIKNLFSGLEVYGCDAPWGAKKGHEINDTDIACMKEWCANNFRLEPATDKINEAITIIANANAFHPVRDYLDTLEWDGKRRIDTWLRDYMGAKAEEPYLSAISRKVLCAMVARIYDPGHKFDQVLILEGKQGVGKSTAVRHLAGDAWFTDSHINISDKDGVLNMRAAWVVELGELSGMRKADVDQLKEFISRRTDRLRLPYGKRVENFPRQCIFIGTTNSSEYLKDTTGNRRFWPVEVGEYDFKGIDRDRDQLFAEAIFALDMGEKLYLDDKEAQAIAMREQSERVFTDSWVEVLEKYFEDQKDKSPKDRMRMPFSMHHLFIAGGPLEEWKENRMEQMRAAECLRVLGYAKARNGNTRRMEWVKVENEIPVKYLKDKVLRKKG